MKPAAPVSVLSVVGLIFSVHHPICLVSSVQGFVLRAFLNNAIGSHQQRSRILPPFLRFRFRRIPNPITNHRSQAQSR
jgi:hypothetical protein